jgi:hypothetical protein
MAPAAWPGAAVPGHVGPAQQARHGAAQPAEQLSAWPQVPRGDALLHLHSQHARAAHQLPAEPEPDDEDLLGRWLTHLGVPSDTEANPDRHVLCTDAHVGVPATWPTALPTFLSPPAAMHAQDVHMF